MHRPRQPPGGRDQPVAMLSQALRRTADFGHALRGLGCRHRFERLPRADQLPVDVRLLLPRQAGAEFPFLLVAIESGAGPRNRAPVKSDRRSREQPAVSESRQIQDRTILNCRCTQTEVPSWPAPYKRAWCRSTSAMPVSAREPGIFHRADPTCAVELCTPLCLGFSCCSCLTKTIHLANNRVIL